MNLYFSNNSSCFITMIVVIALISMISFPFKFNLAVLVSVSALAPDPVAGNSNKLQQRGPRSRPSDKYYYNYFAYGSNVCKSTMENLRGIKPLVCTAAILPEHELRFNIPGMPLVEPSWASVEPCTATTSNKEKVVDVVHGALYKLSEDDFTSVCRSEGVPFGYVLHRCRPVPYRGNANDAGLQALRNGDRSVSAFTLRAPPQVRKSKIQGDIPPSRAYLNVIVRGAKEFHIDQSYIDYLESIQAGRTLFGNGMAESMLDQVEKR